MHKLEIKQLFEKYIDNRCSSEEFKLFVEVLKDADETDVKAVIAELLVDDDVLLEVNAEYLIDMAYIHDQMRGHVVPMDRTRPISLLRTAITIAATLICICALSFYIFSLNDRTNNTSFVENITLDKPPGRAQAMLMTAEGKRIILDDIKVGEVIQENGVTIKKDERGRLKYTFVEQQGSSNRFNTITTPKGGRYEVVLADGSIVWLNSMSSIRFPLSFSDDRRQVSLTGEGYFVVAKDKNRPFLVHTNGKTTKVYGTAFNINSYSDQNKVTVALVEGKISVKDDILKNNEQFLVPGQQMVMDITRGKNFIEHANIEEVTGWKDGWFVFEDMKLKETLLKITRWYDIDVDFGSLPNTNYTGSIPMDVSLFKVLHMLEKTSDLTFIVKDGIIICK